MAKKVLFISDFNLSHSIGGAQRSNDIIIQKGREIGLDITYHNHDSSYTDFLHSYDILISSNLEVINSISQDKLNWILNHKNHVRLEHDSCSYLSDDLRKALFGSAKKSVFLSQFHIDFFKQKYGDYFENTFIVNDPIDTDLFYPDDTPKEFDVVYAGFLHRLKGGYKLVEFAKSNPDFKIAVCGWGKDQNLVDSISAQKNISFLGSQHPSLIADLYRKSEFVFHDPIVNEPFCRMVGEAILCGCKFIGDESKVGSILELKRVGDEVFRDNCNKAASLFWETVL